jgi:hypothetical protein
MVWSIYSRDNVSIVVSRHGVAILDYDASSVLMWAVWTGLAVVLPVLCPLHFCFEPQF